MGETYLTPVHPGEILVEEFIEPLGLTKNKLARLMRVDTPRVNDIARGKRDITADTALRLAKVFGTSERFWLNLQVRYDLEVQRDKIGGELAQIEPVVFG